MSRRWMRYRPDPTRRAMAIQRKRIVALDLALRSLRAATLNASDAQQTSIRALNEALLKASSA